jgi:hypothetical protein
MKDIVERVMADARSQKNIEYGEPRSGHPEGKVKFQLRQIYNKVPRKMIAATVK